MRERNAARVIVVDDAGKTLLFRGGDPSQPEGGTWWFTPGGGLEGNETPLDAARRELLEETGLVVPDLRGPIFHRVSDFFFDGDDVRQSEVYYSARVTESKLSRAGWTDLEKRSIIESRWWTVEELRSTTESVFPPSLATLVEGVLETSDGR